MRGNIATIDVITFLTSFLRLPVVALSSPVTIFVIFILPKIIVFIGTRRWCPFISFFAWTDTDFSTCFLTMIGNSTTIDFIFFVTSLLLLPLLLSFSNPVTIFLVFILPFISFFIFTFIIIIININIFESIWCGYGCRCVCG